MSVWFGCAFAFLHLRTAPVAAHHQEFCVAAAQKLAFMVTPVNWRAARVFGDD